MTCYKLTDGKLVEAQEPVDFDADGDYVSCILKAGYFHQLDSETAQSGGGEITIYETNNADKPKFFIDVWGMSSQIATFVADDVPQLVNALREIAPLISLVGLQQQADIQGEAIEARRSGTTVRPSA